MSRKTNDVKKRPKKGLKIICSVIGCAFALLSVLAPFSGLKTAKADELPPASLGGVSVGTFYGFDLAFSVYDRINLDTYNLYWSMPLSYQFGQGKQEYDYVIAYSDISNRSLHGTFSYDNGVIFAGLNLLGSMDLCGFFSMSLVDRVYVDSYLYDILIKSQSFLFNGFVGDTNYSLTCVIEYVNADDEIEMLSINRVGSINFNTTGALNIILPDYAWLDKKGYTNDGYLCIASFDCILAGNLDGGYVSYNVARSPSNYALSSYKDLQLSAEKVYLPRRYVKVPVDDIGLGVITQAVSEFFNTEFIPGFRLWYFLLIGLGCAIVGIALKFFLGG